MPSGSFVKTLPLRPGSVQFNEFPPSDYWPFNRPSSPFAVDLFKISRLNDFALGFVNVYDVNRWPIATAVPFAAYVGDEWPQAPVGLVHFTRRVEMVEGKTVDFSLLIERAK